MKYILKHKEVKRTVFGFAVVCMYVNPNCILEKPHKIVHFAECEDEIDMIPEEIDAVVVECKLNGKYTYKVNRNFVTDRIYKFCPTTEDGSFVQGLSPEEQVARMINNGILIKVE